MERQSLDKSSSSFVLPESNGKDLLTLAALFEGNFSLDWIVDLTGRRATQVLSDLEEGLQKRVLKKKGPGVYRFADQKERRVLRDHLTLEEREQLHSQIANLLLRDLPEDENKAQTVAYHLFRISNDPEKCRWLIRAGDSNLKVFRTEEALQCYTKVLQELTALHGEEVDHIFIEAAIKYSKISTARHDTAWVLSILQEAMMRAKRTKEGTSEALLEMHIAKNEWLRSQYRNALKHFGQGWNKAKKLNNPKLLRSAKTFSTFFLYWQGRFQEAVNSYEKSVQDVEKYPKGGYPLIAASLVGYCYGLVGHVTQGLGMLDTIRRECLGRGDQYLAAWGGFNIGKIMLDIGRIKDSLEYLECSVDEANQAHNEFIAIQGRLILAYAYFLNGDTKRAIHSLLKFLKLSSKVKMTVQPYPYLMDLCLAMEEGKLPHVSGLSLEAEVHRMIRHENVFMKGVAYRYRAFLQRREGVPSKKIIQSLNVSIKWLTESGHQIQLARSQLELARQHLLLGDKEKAKEITRSASKIMSSHSEDLVPDDVRSLIKESRSGEDLLKEILKLAQEVVTIRDNKDLVQRIISTVNRITGAERGAIFLLDGNERSPQLQLRASKNLTSKDVSHPGFASSIKMVKEVARKGKGRILEMGQPGDSRLSSDGIIRSRICVPMIFRDKVVGVLYHDNRLLSSAFKETDLELLAYFASQAAFALDNAKAYEEIQNLNERLSEEKLYYEHEHLQSLHFEDIVGKSTAIKKVLAQVNQVANTETTILILGETGVGKELVARAIHRHSPRHDKPFIRVHCNALPESLIPSELFGHERGAFTGATSRRIGRFELADGGTIFLDEIGDLSLDVQVRLLRVLQSREFERVGGSETMYSDFRLLAATNRNLKQEIRTQRFRTDLYYRLNVFPIYVPPLRERKEDIPLLAYHFLRLYGIKMGKNLEGITRRDMDRLVQYDWPGNVREMENVIERGIIISPGPQFRLPELGVDHQGPSETKDDLSLEENERRHILSTLQKTRWKVRGPGGAAELLHIHPSTLSFRMKKLGIQRPKGIPKRRSSRINTQ